MTGTYQLGTHSGSSSETPQRQRPPANQSQQLSSTRRNDAQLPLLKASPDANYHTMSYYFAIVGNQDNPLFEHEFGTSKQGGDGQSRFSDQVKHLNQFILHSSLDIAEEVQWSHGQM